MRRIILTIVILLALGKSYSSSYLSRTLTFNKSFIAGPNSLLDLGEQTKALGFLKLKESYQDKLGILKLYNKNGSVWLSFKFTDNFKSPLLNPLLFKSEDGILVFDCISENNDFYAVIVSKGNNIVKFIKKSDSNFLFQTWQQRILSMFSVDFDNKKNPLRESPSAVSKKLHYSHNDFYHPVKINGNWLKVKSNDTNRTGWIKWRNDQGKVLIGLYDEA
ncbi:hypothetical protein BH09BAC6_BH09BAC6_29800 [soil metagenome]|jgi:hypothetical protein